MNIQHAADAIVGDYSFQRYVDAFQRAARCGCRSCVADEASWLAWMLEDELDTPGFEAAFAGADRSGHADRRAGFQGSDWGNP